MLQVSIDRLAVSIASALRLLVVEKIGNHARLDTVARLGRIDAELLEEIVLLAGSPGFERWRAQVRSTGYCARPVRLRGHVCDHNGVRVWSTASEPDGVLRKACGNRREAVCPSCAERYRQDAYQLIASGVRGGKGVPDTVATYR
jgi:hypothetical protein